MMPNQLSKKLTQNRIAVATYFFISGFLYANWIARLPKFQEFLGLNNTQLGGLLFTSALGAIISMPITGWLTLRFGSHRITIISSILVCCVIPFLAVSNIYLTASILFFIIGMLNGSMDVAMNGQAVIVEQKLAKPIMSSFHAIFSIGMALGAGAGALFSQYNIGLVSHFTTVGIFGLIFSIVAPFYLVKDVPTVSEKSEEKEKHGFLPTKAILPLAIVAFCGMTGEGSMADWSALFMNKVVGESKAFGALVFGTFAVAMTIGRLFGDYFTQLFGKRKLLIYDSILAIVGLSIVLIFVTTWATFLGFFLVGLGLATVIPIVYSAAGNTEGVTPSIGIAMATTIGYAGFFIGPPAIGFLADTFGLRLGLLFTLGLFLVMFVLVVKTIKK